MGCSATKSSTVASVNNNNATETKRKSHSDDCNGGTQNSQGQIEQGRLSKKRTSPAGVTRGQLTRKSLPEETQEDSNRDMAGEEVGDDDVFSPAERNGKMLPNGAADDKTNTEDNDDDGGKARNVPLSSPLYNGNREFSRSQTDFFKMLDEKIAKGQSLSSQESVR